MFYGLIFRFALSARCCFHDIMAFMDPDILAAKARAINALAVVW